MKQSKCIMCECEVIVHNSKLHENTLCPKCADEYSKSKRKRINRTRCLNCDSEIISVRKRKFCSKDCQTEYKWKITKAKIESGEYQKSRSPNSVLLLKKYVLDRDGHKCSICGNTEWMGKDIPLVLDHINGRSSDNDPNNLRFVCPNCDRQLPTFGSKNKNSDRNKRREYDRKRLMLKS